MPSSVLFMNAGVKLCCEGSSLLEDLKLLAESGVELLCCGTCLDFYHLKDALQVGRISNMLEILSIQNTAQKVIAL
jgi:intracellular sulfur oxidation DsrE/DsrF family protein